MNYVGEVGLMQRNYAFRNFAIMLKVLIMKLGGGGSSVSNLNFVQDKMKNR